MLAAIRMEEYKERYREEYKGIKVVDIHCEGEANSAIVLEWDAWKMYRMCTTWEHLFTVLVDVLKFRSPSMWQFGRYDKLTVIIGAELLPRTIMEVIEEKLGKRKEEERWVLFREWRKDKEESVLSVEMKYKCIPPKD